VQDNPQNELAWQGMAQEYAVAGPVALPQRLEALTRVIALLVRNPATGRLQAERAEVLLQLGRLDEAAVAARSALGQDNDLALPRWVLASVAEQRGAWTEARDYLRAILPRLKPGHPMVPIVRQRLEAVERRVRGEGRP
jgi:predicted Zn-dependent protease